MLHESCRRHQADTKNKEDFEKLFIKLNYICQLKASKEVQATSWSNKNVINYIYGPIPGFPSGSWWGIRMDCSRDRVHDPFDENIQNGPFGVTSFCTSSNNLNEDVDFGSYLTLTGQKYINGQTDWDPLIKNYENQIPVRLIRSYNLLNEFAPKTGYRYDGLYIVANFWIGVNSDSTKYYKFALLRLTNQDPPIWSSKQTSTSTSTSYSIGQLASLSLQNNSENSSPSPYKFKKCLHSSEHVQKGKYDRSTESLQSPNFETKKTDEKERGTAESAIVTRHVFKKGNPDCTVSTPSTSIMSENKPLTHIGNQGSKAHSTNISIRTGLYDSSHSTQHDVKRSSTLSSFCRTVKPLNLLKTNQHTEISSSSSKDKNKTLDGKVQSIGAYEFPKRVDYILPNSVKSETLKIKVTKDVSSEKNDNPMDVNLSPYYKHENNINKTYEDLTNDSTEIHGSNGSSSETTTNILNTTNFLYRNDNSTLKEAQELKSINSLDTLTPDKILHLINNNCHPLSKLLIGNMIGLTSEQSIDLKPHDLSIDKSENKTKTAMSKSSMKETNEKKNNSDELSTSRYYKFRRHRRLSKKMINKQELMKCENTHDGELGKRSVQSSDALEQSVAPFDMCNGSKANISEEESLDSNKLNKEVKNKIVRQKKINGLQESPKNMKKNMGTRNEIRTRLRTMKAIKPSMKKHINKRQRREIANLLIDAKIGPKVRGPRNRRLRCISNTYSKQSCERYGTGICTLTKCRINPEISGQQSTFKNRNGIIKIGSCKRIRNKQTVSIQKSEALKENRVQKNLTLARKVNKDNVDDKIVINNSINTSDDNKKPKVLKSNVEPAMRAIVVNRRKKLIQPIPTKLKNIKFEGEMHSDSGKEVSKPCKTDAITQCSLIKEPLMRNLQLYDFGQKCNRNEQYTFIKIEYGENKDVRSEVCKAARSNSEKKSYPKHKIEKHKHIESVYNAQHSKNTSTLSGKNILNTKEETKSSMERVSAFVPVNVLDNDLKIARLRSIGFKPIACSNSSNEVTPDQSKRNSSGTFISKVLRQNVAEKYNKYTNEENDIVVYMDEELQYQDIEDEDKYSLCNKRKALKMEGCSSNNDEAEKESSIDARLSLEQDLDSPWHGWKKVVTNTNIYWVGW
ncbi:uncharacterized protein LOC116428213 isoform X2 [Nomia melanderi]|nr:uncharacterized protein LOC116428213 isoform X2 [Nomia melanderi]